MGLMSAPIVSNIQGELFYNYGNPFQLTSLPSLISNILGALLLIGALIVFVCLLWGGWQWMSAGDNESTLQKARDSLTHCLVGFAILALSYAIALLVQGFFGLNSFEEIPFEKNPSTTPAPPPATPTPVSSTTSCNTNTDCWNDPSLGSCYVCVTGQCIPNPGGSCELSNCLNPDIGICSNTEPFVCDASGSTYSCAGQECDPNSPESCLPGTCVDTDGDGVGECTPASTSCRIDQTYEGPANFSVGGTRNVGQSFVPSVTGQFDFFEVCYPFLSDLVNTEAQLVEGQGIYGTLILNSNLPEITTEVCFPSIPGSRWVKYSFESNQLTAGQQYSFILPSGPQLAASQDGGPDVYPQGQAFAGTSLFDLDLYFRTSMCKEDPTPANCTGCMSGGICYPGQTLTQCGVNGEACQSCDLGQTCIAGTCQ